MLITKKAVIEAANTVAGRAPTARNRAPKMVTYRHPRGLIGHTLHAVGLSPSEIRGIQTRSRKSSLEDRLREFLNPAATAWVMEADNRASKGMSWGEVVSSTR